MRWHDRAIHRHHRQIQITGSRMDKTFKKTCLGPTPEPFEDTGPPPKMRREVTPGGSCPEPPENSFQKKTIVHRRAPRVGHLARTQRGHPRPHLEQPQSQQSQRGPRRAGGACLITAKKLPGHQHRLGLLPVLGRQGLCGEFLGGNQ